MRIIFTYILMMRMGEKIFSDALNAIDDTPISPTTKTADSEVNRSISSSPETESTLEGVDQHIDAKETVTFTTEATVEIIVPSPEGVELSQQNKSSLISSSVPEATNTVNPVTGSSSENADIENSKNNSVTNALAKPTILARPVKKISQDTSLQNEKERPLPSPVVPARRCCQDHYNLYQGNCVKSTQPVTFNPIVRNETSHYTFSWETMMLNCAEGFIHKELSFDGNHTVLVANKTNSFLKIKESFLWKEFTKYCIGQLTTGDYAALVCVHDTNQICSTAACVKKCCATNEVMSTVRCKSSNRKFSPLFYTLHGEETFAPEDLRVVSEFPSCSGFTTTSLKPDFNLLSTGKLYLKKTEDIVELKDYCVDYLEDAKMEIAFYCAETHSNVQQWKITLMPICTIISIVFLLIVILCHLITPQLRNVQGFCFLAYSASLMLSYSGFYTNLMYTKQMKSTHCVLNGVFTQCLILSSFFWLSVLCFDIWRVIRASVRGKSLSGILATGGRQLLLYCTYAFGFPLLIALVTLIMQYLPDEYTIGLIVPGFEKESCWFSSRASQGIYFYSFMAILNTLSLAMLMHIFYLLVQTEKSFTLFFKLRTESRAFNRQHMSLFRQRLGLFVMMSICWSTEFLSLVIPPVDMWVVTDILITLQGVIVFLIFVSSRKKRQQVRKVLASAFPCISCKLPGRRPEVGNRNHSKNTSRNTDSSGTSSSASTKTETLPPAGLKRIFRRSNEIKDAQSTENVAELGITNMAYEHGDDAENGGQCESRL